MKPIPQADFDILLHQQRTAAANEDLAHFDLSGLSFAAADLSGITIAMSRFSGTRFDRNHDLGGVTWIGNELENCSFVNVSLNKAELLDCTLMNCTLERVTFLRADLSGTRFERCVLSDLDLTQRTSLLRVSFERCTFRNVKITETLTLNETGNFRFDEQGRPIG